MQIIVNASQLDVGSNVTLTKDEAIAYAREEVTKAADVIESRNKSAHITLSTEGAKNDPVQKVDITLQIGPQTFVQSAHSRSIKKAIDRASAPLRRQVRRQKTKIVDKHREDTAKAKAVADAIAARVPEVVEPDEE